MDTESFKNACNGKSASAGGLNLQEFKREASQMYPVHKETINSMSRKQLEDFCKQQPRAQSPVRSSGLQSSSQIRQSNIRDIVSEYDTLNRKYKPQLTNALWKASVNNRNLRSQLVEIAMNNDDVRRELLLPALDDNYIQLARFVLNGGMDVNFAYDRKGYWTTPLEIALRSEDNMEMLRLLFQAGANPNFVHHKKGTPLVLAIATEDSQIVKLFMDYGANPELRGNDGETAYTFLEQIRDDIGDEKYYELLNLISNTVKEPGMD
jgi:ankyrin repeat protein